MYKDASIVGASIIGNVTGQNPFMSLLGIEFHWRQPFMLFVSAANIEYLNLQDRQTFYQGRC